MAKEANGCVGFWGMARGAKAVVWILGSAVLALLSMIKLGWNVSDYKNLYEKRLAIVEKIQGDRTPIISAIPQMQADISVIKNDIQWIRKYIDKR